MSSASEGNDKWPAIKAECPNCKAPHRFYPYESATGHYTRTCRKCLRRYLIIVTSIKHNDTKGIRFDKVEWVPMKSKKNTTRSANA